jgi:hypothetical protein
MVSIIVVGDLKPYKLYWSVLYEKYKNDEKYDFVFSSSIKEGIKKSKHNKVLITETHSIPTYETMTLLPELGSKELDPVWHEYNVSKLKNTTCDCTWTMMKKDYNNQSREECLKDKEVVRTKMYNLG